MSRYLVIKIPCEMNWPEKKVSPEKWIEGCLQEQVEKRLQEQLGHGGNAPRAKRWAKVLQDMIGSVIVYEEWELFGDWD